MDPVEEGLTRLERLLVDAWQAVDDPTSPYAEAAALAAAIHQLYREQRRQSEP